MTIDFSVFYSSLATIVVMIGLGWFASKRGWIDEHTNRTIINLLLSIVWPCALLTSFPGEFSTDSLNSFLFGAGGGFLVLLVAIMVSRLLFARKRYPKNYFEYQFAFIFNNASFLGFPLISTIFGQAGLVPYAGFILIFNLALFGYGIMLFKDKFSWSDVGKTFINPNVVAVFLGFLLFIFSLTLPKFLNDAVRYTGSMMTPMSLFCIGFMLSRANLLQIIKRKVLVLTCVAQLTLGPLITFGVLKLIGAPSDVVQVLSLIQALPTATSLGLFAEKYRDDVGSASELVAISTILSAVTLPIMVWVMFSLIGA